MPYLGNTPTSVPLSSADLQDGIITSAKIANGTITTADLASGVGGKVLQVVQTVKSDIFSSGSSTFTDITGMSVSITPSSSSNKILVLIDTACGGTTADDYFHLRLLRNSTAIYVGDTAGSNRLQTWWSYYVNSSNAVAQGVNFFRASGTYLDSPATTSSVTYKLQVRYLNDGTFYLNTGSSGISTDASEYGRGASSITVMEIAV